jgi:phosphodiesterase/alkaline phosphatase D-like protein
MSAAALALGVGELTSGQAVAQPTFSGYPFRLGVASGDPEPDGVVLWTRLSTDPTAADGWGGIPRDQSYAVRYEVARDESFRKIVQRGTAEATPELGHSVHPEVGDLSPGREYFYRFEVGGEVSPVGRTKTTPAPGAKPDRMAFAFASCQAWVGGRYAAYRHMAEEDLDLVFHLGDYIYEGGATRSLTDYRVLYARYKTSPDLQAAHRAFPFVCVFDDHEVDNNWADEVPQDNTPNFMELRANAFQVYYEHLPLRRSSMPVGPDMLLYRRLAYGRLAEFSVLDTRQYRSDQVQGAFIAPRDPDSFDPALTMTGSEQERWLLDGLDRSKARWNVLAQQTIMAQYDYDTSSEGVSINHDQWDGYVAARERILNFVRERRPSNPVVISGDWHSNWVNDLKTDFDDPASETIATEFVGTSISSGCGWRGQVEAALGENPHVRFFDGEYRGYVRCEVTEEEWRSELKIVPDPRAAEGPAYTLASFVVATGVPGARQVEGAGDGITGHIKDAGTGEPAPNIAVEARNADGSVASRTTTDAAGEYRLFVQPGAYTVVASGVSYETAERAAVEVREGASSGADFALERIVVAAGTGKVVPGAVSQGSASDIVIENGLLGMAVAVTFDDAQLSGVTKGKPFDMAMRGGSDQIDWFNLPYASATQPRGTEAWQQRTVRNSDVRVVEVTQERAVVRATGASTAYPEVTATTTYTVRPDQEWVLAETLFENTGTTARTVWVGDAMDHDGSGQRSGAAGHGAITAPYGSPAEYRLSEPWIGMTGNDPQVYGLIYDEEGDALLAYGNGNWIMSQRQIELAPGASYNLSRRIVVVNKGDSSDPFAVLAELYRASR